MGQPDNPRIVFSFYERLGSTRGKGPDCPIVHLHRFNLVRILYDISLAPDGCLTKREADGGLGCAAAIKLLVTFYSVLPAKLNEFRILIHGCVFS